MNSALRKERRSFTLSPESVEYLEREQQERKASSTSSVLDDILRERMRAQEEAEIDAAFALMAEDADYQQEAVAMSRDFDKSDWDAFRVGESK